MGLEKCGKVKEHFAEKQRGTKVECETAAELEGRLDRKRGCCLKFSIKGNLPLNLRIKLEKTLTDFRCETFS